MQRVVITGMGCVSPLGLSATLTWQGMRAGRGAIRALTGLQATDLRTTIAAQLPGFDATAHFDDKRLQLLAPFRSTRWWPHARRWRMRGWH